MDIICYDCMGTPQHCMCVLVRIRNVPLKCISPSFPLLPFCLHHGTILECICRLPAAVKPKWRRNPPKTLQSRWAFELWDQKPAFENKINLKPAQCGHQTPTVSNHYGYHLYLFFCLITIFFQYNTIFGPIYDTTVQRKEKIHLRSPNKSTVGLKREPLISTTTAKHFILSDTLPHFQNGIIRAGKRILSPE